MILVKKVFIFSKTLIICLLCPLLCGLFFFWKGAKGELSYKAKKADKISAKFYAQQTGQFLLMQYRNHKFTTKAKSFLILSTATLDDNVCNVS